MMNHRKTKMLCEAALMLAFAQILSYLRLYHFPQGGSVDLAMLPIVLFAVRYGVGWGTLVGLVFGLMQYLIGLSTAIDWTSMVCDYLVAYTLLGFGAALARKGKKPMVSGTLLGGALRFLAHFAVGAVVWGKYMPDMFLGMTMTSPWLYSFLYNAPYMVLSTLLVMVVSMLLDRYLGKYFRGEDLGQ